MRVMKNPKIDLKRKYLRHCEQGAIFSLIILIFSLLYFPNIDKNNEVVIEMQELVDIEDVQVTKHETDPPPPPKPIIPIETPTDDILEEIEIEDTDLDVEEIIDAPSPQLVKEEQSEVQLTFFIAVEEMPYPIGGIAAIQAKIKYPEIAKRAGVQGRVYLKAYVDEEGIPKKVEIIKGIVAGCDEAAAEAVMQIRFSPGRQRGKAVKVQVSIPVLFILRENV